MNYQKREARNLCLKIDIEIKLILYTQHLAFFEGRSSQPWLSIRITGGALCSPDALVTPQANKSESLGRTQASVFLEAL